MYSSREHGRSIKCPGFRATSRNSGSLCERDARALTGYHGNEGLRISEALPPSAMASLTTSQQYARVP